MSLALLGEYGKILFGIFSIYKSLNNFCVFYEYVKIFSAYSETTLYRENYSKIAVISVYA
jgi:hypothetical protein